jgi:hypothetical protein
MGAGHHSRARRLSFLAVVFLFGVVMLAQANVKNASIAQIRLHEMSWPSVRLERENPCRQGVSFESQARLSLEMPIGIFCGGDPVNSFDPDGMLATQAGHIASQGVDAAWNFGLAILSPQPEGYTQDQIQAIAQNGVNTFGSPMKNWFGVNYGSSPIVDTLPAYVGPSVQNAMNSLGMPVGQETPNPTISESASTSPSFYVTADGTAIPATGYRAILPSGVPEAQNGSVESRNPTYITFNNITGTTPGQAQSLLQMPETPTHVGVFDTLQIANNLSIPTEYWNTGLFPEPITVSYPRQGAGGGTQAITYSPIQGVSVVPLQTVNQNAIPSTVSVQTIPVYQPPALRATP